MDFGKVRLPEKYDKRRKLTSEQKVIIEKMYAEGYTKSKIAKIFNVATSTITYAVDKEQYDLAKSKNRSNAKNYRVSLEEMRKRQKELYQRKKDLYARGLLVIDSENSERI